MIMMNWFCGMVDWHEGLSFISSWDHCYILTIRNLQQVPSWILTCLKPEFRLCWRKLYSSDNQYTMVSQQYTFTIYLSIQYYFNKVEPQLKETEEKSCLLFYRDYYHNLIFFWRVSSPMNLTQDLNFIFISRIKVTEYLRCLLVG